MTNFSCEGKDHLLRSYSGEPNKHAVKYIDANSLSGFGSAAQRNETYEKVTESPACTAEVGCSNVGRQSGSLLNASLSGIEREPASKIRRERGTGFQ